MTSAFFLGDAEIDPHKHFTEIHSSQVDEPISTLKDRLNQDGYLCMRGLIPRSAVLSAREQMLSFMESRGALDSDSTFDHPKGKAIGMMGIKEITHHQNFLGAVENPALFSFFDELFEEKSTTFDYKWARAVPPGVAGTGAHMDYVYMGQGSKRLHTTWVPMGDVPRENGPMVLLERSHAVEEMKKIRETYGRSDVDRDRTPGWFSQDYLELSQISGTKWIIGDYQAGDVILMGMNMMHGSLRNTSDYLRLTCDIRFQPTSDPIDERWGGAEPLGHYGRGKSISPEAARQAWGV